MPNTTNFNWATPADTDLVKDGAAAIRTLGNSIDSSFVDLKGGTTGQVLSKTSNTDLDFTWVAQDDSNAIQNDIIDAKGDLISATAADTPARLAVGTNGQVLQADSTTATGLKWGAVTTPTWSAIQTSAFASDYLPFAINYVGSYYLAGGENGTLVTSTDGTSWTARTFGATTDIYGFVSNGTIYLGYGTNTALRSATDPTSTWTSRSTSINTAPVRQVIWDGTNFIAVGGDTASGNKISTSTNGTSWTARLTSSEAFYGVAYDGVGNYLAVGGDSTDRTVATSTNATTWTATTTANGGTATAVVWNGSNFVIVGLSETETYIFVATQTTGGTYTEVARIRKPATTAAQYAGFPGLFWDGTNYYISTDEGIYQGGSSFRFTLLPTGFPLSAGTSQPLYSQRIAKQGDYYYGVGNLGTLFRGTGVGV